MNNPNNEEILAAISAAIAAFEGDSSIKLVVRSIKRVGQMSPVWNIAGRTENISNRLI
jgi:hypothetical protein